MFPTGASASITTEPTALTPELPSASYARTFPYHVPDASAELCVKLNVADDNEPEELASPPETVSQ